jgi:hypothetical protein
MYEDNDTPLEGPRNLFDFGRLINRSFKPAFWSRFMYEETQGSGQVVNLQLVA